jgi:hypothetical protein
LRRSLRPAPTTPPCAAPHLLRGRGASTGRGRYSRRDQTTARVQLESAG